ncbi:MAG: MBL fold metallo-hydrolase [Candidatus Bathyarchaeia archaeon]
MVEIKNAFSELNSIEIKPNELAFFFYKISAIAIKTISYRFLIDSADYFMLNDIKALEKLDLVLITHEHYDHFNKSKTIEIQGLTNAIVACNLDAFNSLKDSIGKEKLILLEANRSQEIKGIKITSIKAIHPGKNPLMFFIEADGLTLFHGSDSGYTKDIEKHKKEVKVAFVPVGSPSPTANVNDALKMVKALNCKMAIPIHGTEDEMLEFKKQVNRELPNVEVIIAEPLKVYKV